jgi:hypothetical protein
MGSTPYGIGFVSQDKKNKSLCDQSDCVGIGALNCFEELALEKTGT